MQRRDFIRLSALASAATGLGACTVSSSAKMPDLWAWCSIDPKLSDDKMLSFFKKYQSHGITGLLSSGSNELYQRGSKIARKAGVQLHAWRWTMNRGQYRDIHPEMVCSQPQR
jgi:TAT (twin-arginine translocation) pathway signal sequence